MTTSTKTKTTTTEPIAFIREQLTAAKQYADRAQAALDARAAAEVAEAEATRQYQDTLTDEARRAKHTARATADAARQDAEHVEQLYAADSREPMAKQLVRRHMSRPEVFAAYVAAAEARLAALAALVQPARVAYSRACAEAIAAGANPVALDSDSRIQPFKDTISRIETRSRRCRAIMSQAAQGIWEGSPQGLLTELEADLPAIATVNKE